MSSKVAILVGAPLLAVAGGTVWWTYNTNAVSTPPSGTATIGTTTENPLLDRIVSSGPLSRPRDFFRVIDLPAYLSVDDAAESMSDDEVVLGLEAAAEYRAYPINYLNDHEMVREEIGELPLLVTW